MKRAAHFPLLFAALWLSGCAAAPVISAVPGALLNVVSNQLGDEDESFPHNIRPMLAAVQQALRSMRLDVDVLEIRNDGYAIAFNNEKLNGEIRLEKMTPKLTTMHVRVRSRVREESVERAIIKSVRARLKLLPANARFRFVGYHNLRQKPSIKTARLGWYRPQAKLDTHRHGKSSWYRLKLPSGKIAYLKKSRVVAVASR